MNTRQITPTHLVFVMLMTLLVACTTSPDTSRETNSKPSRVIEKETAVTLPTNTPAPTLTPTPTEEPSLAVRTLDEVRLATIQIEAQGTFMDPEIGEMQTFAGLGSGFIIDETGLAVTNNHVVTGAAIIKVWVHGDSEPRHARIVAVSECSDLAVIDIDGEGFQYLDWYDDSIVVGTDVYAAGFPLGDPEYTLTKGIVSKEHANGQVSWASVEFVIEHDATINPGNSGGPLVSANGAVLGINYAAFRDANQYFAITRDEALDIVGELSTGNDVDSIGINGLAVTDGNSLSGIWVSSVKSGAPSDFAGILPGDILLKLEGMALAQDGTMGTYCDIIRTHGPESTLTVEVLRLETGEILKGQLNGKKLEVISTLEEEESTSHADADGYMEVTDDYELIGMEVPAGWNDVDGSAWTIGDDVVGAMVIASPDLEQFYSGYSTPGVIFGASNVLARKIGYVQLLENSANAFQEDCQYDGRYDYDDGLYRGKYDVWFNCHGAGNMLFVISAVSKDNPTDFLILVTINITEESQSEAIDHIVMSFQVYGDLAILTKE